MPVVETFRTSIQAMNAAAYLNERGVPATVVNEISAYGGLMGMGVHVDDENLARARGLLTGFWEVWRAEVEASGAAIEPVPDLSRLPREFAPACPACSARLPLDASLQACPLCGAQVDVAEIIVNERGPDALVACYDSEPLGDEVIDQARVQCPMCHYSLYGLAASGPCPECGVVYDKRAMLGDDTGGRR